MVSTKSLKCQITLTTKKLVNLIQQQSRSLIIQIDFSFIISTHHLTSFKQTF